MGSLEENHSGDCAEGVSVEQSVSLDSSDAYNVFGEPQLSPRVGEEYQVEVPPLLTRSEYFVYSKNPFDLERVPRVSCDFLIGLPIPLTRISKESEYIKDEGRRFFSDSNDISRKNGVLKHKTKAKHDTSLRDEDVKVERENGLGSVESSNQGSEQEVKHLRNHKYGDKGNFLVPGFCDDSWSNIDEARFLLGLYFFEKKFFQVKKFVENKKMIDIQSFYYGKFYRSNEYQRWADCRKKKSKRYVCGDKIFTRLRQQELLSRLYRHVSEECQNTLLEVLKSYLDGKMKLDEYVFTLKAIVGPDSLVEAMAIGRGKLDLTSNAIEPSKSNQNVQLRPEIPIGKACSSLTPEQIVNFLTGDFRLSKARSNDLFWEAVWPRLLARGWHSEQPKGQIYTVGAKQSLVFLIPGVKKFSRRKLAKGDHYFDSVTDVLQKVASEPGLINLETEADEADGNKEETNTEQEDLSDRQRHCYLQPRTPNRISDLMKFTVVDTSLPDGKLFKVREFSTLPREVSKMTLSESNSEESNNDSSELVSEDSFSDDMPCDQEEANHYSSRNADYREKGIEISTVNQEFGVPDTGNEFVETSKDLNKFKQPKKFRVSREEDSNHSGTVTKRRRRLSACSRADMGQNIISVSSSLEQEKHVCCSDTAESSANNHLPPMGSFQKRVSPTSSSRGSPLESGEGVSSDTNYGSEGHHRRNLIDLNLPQLSPDMEADEASVMGLSEGQDIPIAAKPSSEVTSSEQQNTASRRQSTRNRPPTARVLEALANGYLTTNTRKKKKKNKETESSRPPRRARFGTDATEDFSAASQTEEAGNSAYIVEVDMLGKFQDFPEGDPPQVRRPYM